MNITITTTGTSNELNTIVDTVCQSAKMVCPDAADSWEVKQEIRKAVRNGGTVKEFPGGRFSFKSDDVDYKSYTVTLDVQEEATIEACAIAIKMAKFITPAISMVKAMVDTFRYMRASYKDVWTAAVADFKSKFGKQITWRAVHLYNADMDLNSVVVAKDDGFGNHFLTRCYHVGSEYDFGVLTAFYEKEMERCGDVVIPYIDEDEAYAAADNIFKDLREALDAGNDADGESVHAGKDPTTGEYYGVVVTTSDPTSNVPRYDVHTVAYDNDLSRIIIIGTMKYNNSSPDLDAEKLGDLLTVMYQRHRIGLHFHTAADAAAIAALTHDQQPMDPDDVLEGVQYIAVDNYAGYEMK